MGAMMEGIDLVAEHLLRSAQGCTVLIRGDSDLAVKFMSKVYKPKKRQLAAAVQLAREKLKQMRGLHFCFEHVPRERNQWADFLSQVALD